MELPIPENAPESMEALLEQLGEPELGLEAAPDPEAGEFRDGASPDETVPPDPTDMLFQPDASTESLLDMPSDVTPLDEGTMLAPFTSSRLVPTSARQFYPYRAAGKLFFRLPDGRTTWCSAAVLRPRIILTAGHCVHSGSGGANGWYSNWLFVPAYENGNAPYQAWNWRWAITTGSWANSNGVVPNQADFAIIELEDRPFNNVPRRIGEVVGYFGYHTNVLQRNHTTKLGYPGNLDSGEIMNQVSSGDFREGGSQTVLYGSDARGGSSGGAWVMNFGARHSGQTGGLRPWPNRIVGVTSYGYVATGPKVQGSSILNNEFLTILNTACEHRAGNC